MNPRRAARSCPPFNRQPAIIGPSRRGGSVFEGRTNMNTPIDISKKVLQTERLVLRRWRRRDLSDFFEYASVDGVGQPAGWPPHRNKRESLAVLKRFIAGKRTFAIEYGGKVIGSIGVERYDEQRFPELSGVSCRSLGFVIGRPYWGIGLMPEAVNAVLAFLFTEIGLDAVLCGHFLTNTRSARVQEKCGFRHYAFGSIQTAIGTHEDEINIITREEWLLRRGVQQS